MPCSIDATRLKTFVEKNSIKIIFFKGGVIERRLCDGDGIKYFDIGSIVPKVESHDLRQEVHSHFRIVWQ